MTAELEIRDTTTPWFQMVLASVDEGISRHYVGELHHAGQSFVGHTNLLNKFDEDDRAAILAEIRQRYPQAKVSQHSVMPASWEQWAHADDPPQRETEVPVTED